MGERPTERAAVTEADSLRTCLRTALSSEYRVKTTRLIALILARLTHW
jgi:hypothetical protein